MSIVRSESLLS